MGACLGVEPVQETKVIGQGSEIGQQLGSHLAACATRLDESEELLRCSASRPPAAAHRPAARTAGARARLAELDLPK